MEPESDEVYRTAANLISNASFLIVGAGAGMSVDSGLSTYADVSNLPWFKTNNLTYRDLSNPDLLVKNPDWFYAWAACCFDAYKKNKPHEGYQILCDWRDKYFSASESRVEQEIVANPFKPNAVDKLPGDFFVYTTNVDGYFRRAGIREHELCETHGNYFTWQCGGLFPENQRHAFKFFRGPCVQPASRTWKIPLDFEFNYDTSNMTCPEGEPKHASSDWKTNRPLCPHCNTLARPNVYNFGDQCFLENTEQENNKSNWLHAVEKLLKRDSSATVVMLEIGVGQRLPKLRVTFERFQETVGKENCAIIRINPEVKTAKVEPGLISIPISGMEALQRINQHMK